MESEDEEDNMVLRERLADSEARNEERFKKIQDENKKIQDLLLQLMRNQEGAVAHGNDSCNSPVRQRVPIVSVDVDVHRCNELPTISDSTLHDELSQHIPQSVNMNKMRRSVNGHASVTMIIIQGYPLQFH